MPAKRLPWIKFWPEAVDHAKVAQLGDAEFRTWITMLARAAQQPTRWHFASRRHAAVVTGRPLGHIHTLVNFNLLDDDDKNGLWVHDWRQWQDRYASDFDDTPNPDPTPDEHSRNGAAKPPPSHREHSANTPPTLPEHSDSALLQKGEERRETNTPLTPQGARQKVPKPKVERKLISDDEIEDLVGKYAERYGNRQSVRDEIDQALNHQARLKCVVEKLYVDGWLRRELNHRPGWRVVGGRQGQTPRTPIDRTGVAN